MDAFHAGDRWSVLSALDGALRETGGGLRLPVLVQVNVSGEATTGTAGR